MNIHKFYTVKSAAEALGTNKVTLGRKIRRHGLVLPNVGTQKRPIYIILPDQLTELAKLS